MKIESEEKVSNYSYISNQIIADTFNHDFLPVALTTSILAPLNRIKIILQTMPLISINESEKVYRPSNLVSSMYFLTKIFLTEIFQDQGLFSLWRGNSASMYRQFMVSYSNLFIYRLIKDKENKQGFFKRLYYCTLSSFLSSLFSYPFELTNTRMSADMTRFEHKRLYSSSLEVFTKIIEEDTISRNRLISNFSITRLYKGYSINLFSSIIYWTLTLGCFEKLDNYFTHKKINAGEDYQYYLFPRRMYLIFGATTLNTIFASIIIYPLDTFKRHIQVNESLGFNSEYSNSGILSAFKKFINQGKIYRGFSVYLLKTLPFSMIHYCFYTYSFGHYYS